ncbi:MAG: nitroreductase family protein, partial [Caldilineaceae bacterium]|nr:nitroreductase family protein [Caldilineaceae bacterium]
MIQDEDFVQLIQGRRSIRRYQDRPIAPALLDKLLTAAMWAPSAHNRQPWRFCV